MTRANASLDSIETALQQLADTREGDPLPRLIALFDRLRPPRRQESAEAQRRWHHLLTLLQRPAYRDGVAAALWQLFARRRHRSLYTEAGLLPNSGFFSELLRKLGHQILPELPDDEELRDCVHALFHCRGDHVWMDGIPREERAQFWRLLDPHQAPAEVQTQLRIQLYDAALILSHRISVMGLEPELLRVVPDLRQVESPFLALHTSLAAYLAGLRESRGEFRPEEDEQHLEVLLEQCRQVVTRARHAATRVGSSLSLTYLLTRLDQHLTRLELLVQLVAAHGSAAGRDEVVSRWATFLTDVFQSERERNSLRRHFADLFGQLALNITLHAARTGEHYIARDLDEWRGMWLAAGGGGLLIALLALLKLQAHNLHFALLNQALVYGLIYGCGFMLVHLLHCTIATKQPAMTAAAIAATVKQNRGQLRQTGELVELVVATSRSQFAAIAGNVLVALPLACALGLWAGVSGSGPLIPVDKAASLLHDVSPFASLALFYAAIAGVWLFMAGLVTGHVDNLTVYERLAPRVAALPWLRRALGAKTATKLGDYLGANAGGLVGNLFFGLMLGLTPAFGTMLGLPLDIRHIAFSAANLGYAVTALEFNIAWPVLREAALGVSLIGLVNLLVSFSLALTVALRSQGVALREIHAILPPLGRRLLESPFDFLLLRREKTD